MKVRLSSCGLSKCLNISSSLSIVHQQFYELRETLSSPHPKAPFRWIFLAPTTPLFPPLSETALLFSMAMMVTIPPSCLRPPPDPPPPSFLGLMQHCSSSLKMMVTALPPLSQPRPPSDPARNKHLPIETPPVKPPEPPDPPDVSVSLVLFTSSSSSPQATQVLDLMFNFSRVSSKLSDDGVVLVFTGDTIFVNWRSSPVVYRLYFCQLGNGSFLGSYSNFDFINPLIDVEVHLSYLLSVYSYSFEKDAMLDVWVTLDLWFLALFGSVLMDSVSFGYIFVPLSGLYVALMQLSTAVCSPIIVFNLELAGRVRMATGGFEAGSVLAGKLPQDH
ncbi:hypothetical protein YC2023_078454 [Brassica napus]